MASSTSIAVNMPTSALSHVILKANGNCNLSCSYCYYMKQRPKEARRAMSLPTARSTLVAIAECLAEELAEQRHVTVYWHGGEPLLQPLSFWEGVALFQETLSESHGVRWTNRLTTNGTLVTAELARFIAEHHYSVGVSVDGPRERHDANRPYGNGRGSFDAALRGYRLLQSAGVKPGLLAVLPDYLDAGPEIYRTFRGLEADRVDLQLPLFNWTDSSGGLPRARRLSIEILKFFDLWLSDGRPMKARLFDSGIDKLATGKAEMCHHEDICDQVLTVEPDGSLHICDDLVSVRGQDTALSKILAEAGSAVRNRNFRLVAEQLVGVVRARGYFNKAQQCYACQVFDLCGGGCPATRWNGTDYSNVSVHCVIYLGLFGLLKELSAQSDSRACARQAGADRCGGEGAL